MTIPVQAQRKAVNPLLLLLTASAGCAMTVLDTNVAGIVLRLAVAAARNDGRSFRAAAALSGWHHQIVLLGLAGLMDGSVSDNGSLTGRGSP